MKTLILIFRRLMTPLSKSAVFSKKTYLLLRGVQRGSNLIFFIGMLIIFTNSPAAVASEADSSKQAIDRSEGRPWTIGLPLWVPGFRGQFAVGGVEVEGGSEEENGFSHLFLDEYSLDFYLVGLVNYRWKNWRFHLDVFDGTIGRSTTFTLTDKSILDAKVQLLMPRLFAGYNFLYKKSPIGPITNWQLYMGGRMYYVNLEISMPRNLGKYEGTKNWFTFLIGTELTFKIFKRLSLIASGDIGGFAASNKLTLFGQVTLNYQPWDVFSVNIGYVVINIEEDREYREEIKFKANLAGPTLGIAFHF